MPNLWSLRSTHSVKSVWAPKGGLCLCVQCVRWELPTHLCNGLPLDTEGTLLLMPSCIYKPLQKYMLVNSFQKYKKALWIFCKLMGGQRSLRLSDSTNKDTKTLLGQIDLIKGSKGNFFLTHLSSIMKPLSSSCLLTGSRSLQKV